MNKVLLVVTGLALLTTSATASARQVWTGVNVDSSGGYTNAVLKFETLPFGPSELGGPRAQVSGRITCRPGTLRCPRHRGRLRGIYEIISAPPTITLSAEIIFRDKRSTCHLSGSFTPLPNDPVVPPLGAKLDGNYSCTVFKSHGSIRLKGVFSYTLADTTVVTE